METTTTLPDESRTAAFADRLVGTINGGALALMISIGHRTGLFDAMAGLAPATTDEIAARAGLQERYVREWLGAMVTGGVVDYSPESGRYTLPPEHAASLTREHPRDNLAVFAQYVALLGGVEDRIVECFSRGGGVPYAAFERFHEVMAEDSGQGVVSALLDDVLPLAPGLRERLEAGIDVLDVGCGSGRAINLLARAFPRSRFTGYDFSEEAIAAARAEASGANATFAVRDVSNLGHDAEFDLITAFDAIHDQIVPATVLAGIEQALRPGGLFLMVDINASSDVEKNREHPLGPLLYTISCMHCMTVSLSAGGAGLGAMWGREQALAMLHEAGFGEVDVRHLDHDIQNSYYIVRKKG